MRSRFQGALPRHEQPHDEHNSGGNEREPGSRDPDRHQGDSKTGAERGDHHDAKGNLLELKADQEDRERHRARRTPAVKQNHAVVTGRPARRLSRLAACSAACRSSDVSISAISDR